MTRVCKI